VLRRLGVPIVLALTVCSVAASSNSAATVDWKSLPYFQYPSRLKLSTDGSWGGATVVDAGKFLNLQPDLSWPKLPRKWIWARTCPAAEQRVVFTKTFLAPGVPYEGYLHFFYGPGNQLLGNRPYEFGVFEINGVAIGRLGNIAASPRRVPPELTVKLTSRALRAFRHGANTATISVGRAALKRGDPCTHPNNAKTGGNVRYIAVGADLSLEFGSDLRAVASTAPKQVQRVANGQAVSIQGITRFANSGPSTSLGGTVVVSVSGDGQAAIVEAATHPAAPLTGCRFEGTRLTCTYGELRGSAQTSISVFAGLKVNTGFFRNGVGKLMVQWTIDGPARDPKGGNEIAQGEVVLCTQESTDPACRG
jgi:hypothetical protein